MQVFLSSHILHTLLYNVHPPVYVIYRNSRLIGLHSWSCCFSCTTTNRSYDNHTDKYALYHDEQRQRPKGISCNKRAIQSEELRGIWHISFPHALWLSTMLWMPFNMQERMTNGKCKVTIAQVQNVHGLFLC